MNSEYYPPVEVTLIECDTGDWLGFKETLNLESATDAEISEVADNLEEALRQMRDERSSG
jgi:hypothetical protein